MPVLEAPAIERPGWNAADAGVAAQVPGTFSPSLFLIECA